MSRDQLAAFLFRALDLPPSDVDAFDDDDGTYFENEINALTAAGITAGVAEGLFAPDIPIPRGPAATFLARAFGLTPID